MLRDLVIVGAGPVGATLALALADDGLDAVALDARPAGALGRGDRSLALSHGARLILERLGIWSAVAATHDAVTPITAIDISQRGGFGRMRLDALEQGLPALGYVVSYRALQAALDAALGRAENRVVYGARVTAIRTTPSYAAVDVTQAGAGLELSARLVAVADGGGELISGLKRHHHDYGQVAVVGKLAPREPQRGVARRRGTGAAPRRGSRIQSGNARRLRAGAGVACNATRRDRSARSPRHLCAPTSCRPRGGHCVHARPAWYIRKRRATAALAARVGTHYARCAAGGEARVRARDDFRLALTFVQRCGPTRV